MAHKFVVMISGELHVYENFMDIPQEIDHVIEFLPEVPPPPHTDEHHQEIAAWPNRLKELMEREHASSRKNG